MEFAFVCDGCDYTLNHEEDGNTEQVTVTNINGDRVGHVILDHNFEYAECNTVDFTLNYYEFKKMLTTDVGRWIVSVD